MISKVVQNSEEAIMDIGDGSILMLGGFNLLEQASKITAKQVVEAIEAKLNIDFNMKEMTY